MTELHPDLWSVLDAVVIDSAASFRILDQHREIATPATDNSAGVAAPPWELALSDLLYRPALHPTEPPSRDPHLRRAESERAAKCLARGQYRARNLARRLGRARSGCGWACHAHQRGSHHLGRSGGGKRSGRKAQAGARPVLCGLARSCGLGFLVSILPTAKPWTSVAITIPHHSCGITGT